MTVWFLRAEHVVRISFVDLDPYCWWWWLFFGVMNEYEVKSAFGQVNKGRKSHLKVDHPWKTVDQTRRPSRRVLFWFEPSREKERESEVDGEGGRGWYCKVGHGEFLYAVIHGRLTRQISYSRQTIDGTVKLQCLNKRRAGTYARRFVSLEFGGR